MAEQEKEQTSDQQNQQTSPPLVFFRDPEDFEALYANNVQAESSVWDLKVIFGILDQSSVPHKVVQHTSINLPWAQIKLLSYMIRLNIAIHEAGNGKIFIPQNIMPPDPDKLELAALPAELRQTLSAIYKDWISTL
jgi:hypothetical protein